MLRCQHLLSLKWQAQRFFSWCIFLMQSTFHNCIVNRCTFCDMSDNEQYFNLMHTYQSVIANCIQQNNYMKDDVTFKVHKIWSFQWQLNAMKSFRVISHINRGSKSNTLEMYLCLRHQGTDYGCRDSLWNTRYLLYIDMGDHPSITYKLLLQWLADKNAF
jgi:hypothetical protein